MKKWANELNRVFSKEAVQMTKKMKKTSTSLALRNTNQNQIKIPVYSPRMAITKNTNNNECCGGGVEKKKPSHTAHGNVN
jgi:hypothetical protein